MFEIRDASGRRMVFGRATSGEAIDTIAKAVAGSKGFPRDRREAWLHLRDKMGFRVLPTASTNKG